MVINSACKGHNLYINAVMPPTSKKLKGQIGLGLFACLSIYPPTPPHCAQTPTPRKKEEIFLFCFIFRYGYFVKQIHLH